MSILIKGMEMPTSCSVCPMLEGDSMDGLCHAASKWLDDDKHWTWYVYPEGDIDDSKPCNCPLIPVPPHGDLIDRDEYRDEFMNGVYALCSDDSDNYRANAIIDLWDYAPTIIPAEEGE